MKILVNVFTWRCQITHSLFLSKTFYQTKNSRQNYQVQESSLNGILSFDSSFWISTGPKLKPALMVKATDKVVHISQRQTFSKATNCIIPLYVAVYGFAIQLTSLAFHDISITLCCYHRCTQNKHKKSGHISLKIIFFYVRLNPRFHFDPWTTIHSNHKDLNSIWLSLKSQFVSSTLQLHHNKNTRRKQQETATR